MDTGNFYVKNLKVENYKSLKNSEIELKKGLNVVIGKNGAGKSNLLEFLYAYQNYLTLSFFGKSKPTIVNYSLLTEYKENDQPRFFYFSIDRVWSNPSSGTKNAYILTIKLSDINGKVLKEGGAVIDTTLNKLYNQDKDIYEEFMKVFMDKRYVSFAIPQDSTWVSKPYRFVIAKDNQSENFNEEDTGFAFFRPLEFSWSFNDIHEIVKENISNDLIREKLSDYLADYLNKTLIIFYLNQYTCIKSIRFNPNINIYDAGQNIIIENLLIDFLVDDDWLPWSYLSDGTKRMFYLISETLSLKDGILLVEEPELGIHPHQLYKIMDFLKEQSRNKQIIISTHSPLVLDALDQDELDRIIIAKYDNGTKFSHLTDEEISKARKYMNEVGELSYYWLHSDLEK